MTVQQFLLLTFILITSGIIASGRYYGSLKERRGTFVLKIIKFLKGIARKKTADQLHYKKPHFLSKKVFSEQHRR